MKQIAISILLLMVISLTIKAQVPGSIFPPAKGGKRYYQIDDKRTSFSTVKSLLKGNPASVKDFQSYNVTNTVGMVVVSGATVATVTTFFFELKYFAAKKAGDTEGAADYSKKMKTGFIVSGSLLIVGLPFALISSSKLKKSITIYNNSLPQSVSRTDVSLELGLVGNGFGARLRF